jgi:predicted DNA-binding protein
MKPPPKKTLGVRMDYITVKQIDALSALTGETKSQVVRILIKKALQGTIITNL